MRILHTSDWHLGRSFGPVPLRTDQERFLDWLVGVVEEERVDLVVVAGDLYDRAIPPAESVALLRETLDRLVARRVRVVAIAGNHDGPERVAAYDGLTELAGVVVRGGFARAGVVSTLELDDGPLDVVALPYLDPVLAPASWHGDLPADGPGEGLPAPAAGLDDDGPRELSLFDQLEAERPVRRTHHGVLEQALARARASRRSPRSLVVAHAFVSGALPSESERVLSLGGTGEVGLELFDGFDYVALGHLHRPQRVRAGLDTVRYSGTPLPYSFSETHPKQVVLVDMAADGRTEVRTVPVPVGRPVATVTGRLDDLLTDRAHDAVTGHFVRAVLTDPGYVVDAKVRLQARFAHVVEVELRPDVAHRDDASTGASAPARGRLAPLEAAVGFWLDMTGEAPDGAERSLLESVFAHVASAEAGR